MQQTVFTCPVDCSAVISGIVVCESGIVYLTVVTDNVKCTTVFEGNTVIESTVIDYGIVTGDEESSGISFVVLSACGNISI